MTSGLRDHAGYWLRRLADAVHVAFERKLAAHDVTVAQWTVLVAVFKGDATTPLEAATYIGIDRGATTRLVDRLVAKGLIARAADPVDRRSVRLTLTDAGRELVPRLAALADENDAAYFNRLPAGEYDQFTETLTRLLAASGIEASGRWRRWRRGNEETMSDPGASIARSETRQVTIDLPPEAVFRYLADLANWPAWAIVNVKAVRRPADGDWWDLTTPLGSGKLRIRPNHALGILDHDFVGPDASWTVPARVVANGAGSTFMMTFFQPPVFTDEVFDAQMKLLDVELATLKELLERGEPRL